MSSFKIATPIKVESHVPEKLENANSPQNRAFFGSTNDAPKDFFILNPEISHFIGLTAARSKEEKRRFDSEVLTYVQKIKDNAFQEAYEQGLQKGIEESKKEAFNQEKQEIGMRLRTFTEICEKINKMTKLVFEQNEKDIVDLCYLMAEKVIQRTVQKEPGMIFNVFQQVLKHQVVTNIQISEEDFNYFEKNKSEIGLDLDLSQMSVEVNRDLAPGDVLFSNDVGILDGTLQSRIEMLRQIVTEIES
jgi:flagellar biosynthesis/type III secretory pathway protein FliH